MKSEIKAVSPECLLSFIFNKKRIIKLKTFQLHRILYNLKLDPKYSKILENIRFTGSPINPYSEAIEEALFNLQFSDAVILNLNAYIISSKFIITHNNLMKEINKEQKRLLKKIASKIL